MKFAFFGYDFSLPVLERLAAEGHEPLAVFSFECDNVFNFNEALQDFAQDRGLPFSLEKPRIDMMEALAARGCACFLSTGYPYKIPPLPPGAYGVNVHPSFLPKGRGLMPTPYIILDHPEAGGLSLHKLSAAIDGGDILAQEKLEISPQETVETYSARVALRMPEAVSRIMADLPRYWEEAKPQEEAQALYFPPPDEKLRMLDWTLPVERLARIGRAFGRFGCLCRFEESFWAVFHFDAWKEAHDHAPGTVVLRAKNSAVITAADGFVCLKDFQRVGQEKT
ncbi:MAG: hypothetical protein K9G62_02815 [Alphaproteobacteria bacterium]|nr:hypothetical protein [Alphaproteobacteria bacterium]